MKFDDLSLSVLLNAECVAMSGFSALLREEQLALVRGDLDKLPAFAEAKAGRLLELTRMGAQRAQWLRQHGLPHDPSAFEQWLDSHQDQAPRSMPAWGELLETTRSARQYNDVNGTLINARLSGTQRALSVLFRAANLNSEYASDGRSVCYRPSQHLAMA